MLWRNKCSKDAVDKLLCYILIVEEDSKVHYMIAIIGIV